MQRASQAQFAEPFPGTLKDYKDIGHRGTQPHADPTKATTMRTYRVTFLKNDDPEEKTIFLAEGSPLMPIPKCRREKHQFRISKGELLILECYHPRT